MPGGTAKITEKGQVTIPRDIRERFNLEPGATVLFVEIDGKLVVSRIDDIKELFRKAHEEARRLGITRADVNRAVNEARKRTGAEYRKKYGLPRRA